MEQEKLRLWCQSLCCACCLLVCSGVRSVLSNTVAAKLEGACAPLGSTAAFGVCSSQIPVLFWLLAAMEIAPVCPGGWLTSMNT